MHNHTQQLTSPFNERFSKIQEKLGQIPLNQESSRANRIDMLDNRCKNVEDKFNDVVQGYNKKINTLKDEVIRLQKLLDEDNKGFEYQLDQRSKEIINLDQKLTSKLQQEIVSRKESENKLTKYLEEKINFLKSDVGMEGKIRGEIIESLNQTLEADLPKLYDMIKQEGVEREDSDSFTLKKTSEEIKKLNDQIQLQRKTREESEGQIFDMLKDLVNRVKSEIDDERKDRESSQETLLTLLEEATTKIYITANN